MGIKELCKRFLHVPTLMELQYCQSEEVDLAEWLRKLCMYSEWQLVTHRTYILQVAMKAASAGWLLCCGRNCSLPWALLCNQLFSSYLGELHHFAPMGKVKCLQSLSRGLPWYDLFSKAHYNLPNLHFTSPLLHFTFPYITTIWAAFLYFRKFLT